MARKKKRGGTTYGVSSFDPPDDKMIVEDIRVWDVSTSKKTGRVSASRRTVEHHHTLGQPGGPSMSRGDEEDEHAGVQDTGTLADSEAPPETVRKGQKRRRAKAANENNSVSRASFQNLFSRMLTRFQTRMEQWLQHRPAVLDELLRLNGLGDALNTPGHCADCLNALARFRCTDCFGGTMCCSACILLSHRNLPLHRLQVRRMPHHPDLRLLGPSYGTAISLRQ